MSKPSMYFKNEDTQAAADRFKDRRQFSRGRSSSIRKTLRLMRIAAGLRPESFKK